MATLPPKVTARGAYNALSKLALIRLQNIAKAQLERGGLLMYDAEEADASLACLGLVVVARRPATDYARVEATPLGCEVVIIASTGVEESAG